MSRCIYCWEELSVETDPEEAAWHNACEREMDAMLKRAVLFRVVEPMQEAMARSLRGQPPIGRAGQRDMDDAQ